MLVICRTSSEKTIIKVPPSIEWQTIEVTVTEVRGNNVRLGFTADKRISIVRDDAIRKEPTP